MTESGSAAGVTNDAQATKTVSFKVTDDGNGKLTVERLGAASDPASRSLIRIRYSRLIPV